MRSNTETLSIQTRDRVRTLRCLRRGRWTFHNLTSYGEALASKDVGGKSFPLHGLLYVSFASRVSLTHRAVRDTWHATRVSPVQLRFTRFVAIDAATIDRPVCNLHGSILWAFREKRREKSADKNRRNGREDEISYWQRNEPFREERLFERMETSSLCASVTGSGPLNLWRYF